MNNERDGISQVVILCDESAAWKVAGLAQLDRLVFAINEFAETIASAPPFEVAIFWKSGIPISARWIPRSARLQRVHLTEFDSLCGTGMSIMSTRLFVTRNAMAEFLSAARRVPDGTSRLNPAQAWQELSELCQQPVGSLAGEGWFFLAGPADFGRGERLLLQRTGKSQDGIVSKFLNRPISRLVTRRLLKFPITPNAWTMLTLALSGIAFFFLLQGHYSGFVIGTAVFHLVNILDGCDGEIARAKYLESERGARLDALCDLLTNLIFILCLGLGLFRQPEVSTQGGVIYLLESIGAFLLIAVRTASYAVGLAASDTMRPLDRRDGEEIIDSSQHLLGTRLTAFLLQLTKRDVIFFFFLLLAIAGRPSWILHIISLFAVVTLILRVRNGGLRSR